MEPSLRWRQVKINSDGGKFNSEIEKKDILTGKLDGDKLMALGLLGESLTAISGDKWR
jgi:hypothetical protein